MLFGFVTFKGIVFMEMTRTGVILTAASISKGGSVLERFKTKRKFVDHAKFVVSFHADFDDKSNRPGVPWRYEIDRKVSTLNLIWPLTILTVP